jgi:hypothetical protein
MAHRTGFLVDAFGIDRFVGISGTEKYCREQQGGQMQDSVAHGLELLLYLIIIRN